jgi:Rod binding domain-containing protein
MMSSTGLGSLNVSGSLQQTREDRMMQGMRPGAAGSNDDARIEKSSKEFESILMGSWLQQAEQSFATVPGAEDDENAATREQTMSFAVQSLATSMAASGGIGIGKMVAKALHAQADKAEQKSLSEESAGIKKSANENGLLPH